MPSRSLWILLSLAGLAALSLWWIRPVQTVTIRSKEVPRVSTETQFRGETQKLEPEQPIEAELQSGEGHRYEVDLEAGQYVHLVADQRGIDVAVCLIAPGGSQLAEVDSPNGDQGPEHVFEISETSGRFLVEIFADSAAHGGRYEVKLDAPRPATEADRQHVHAFRLFQEGEVLRRLKTADAGHQAVAKYEEALGLWRELADREWEAESLYRIGWVHHDLNESSEALAALQQALPLYQALGKRDEEGMTLTRYGMLELHNGHTEEAIELHRRAVEIHQQTGKMGLQASAFNSLGAAYDVAGEAQKALDVYRLGLERAQAAGDRPEEEASALRGIGEILIDQGKLEPAMDSLRQALAVYRLQRSQSDTIYTLTYTLSRMAAISQRLGRMEDALSQLQEALTLQQENGDREGEIVTLHSLGTVHLLRKENAKAAEAYTTALSLAKSTGSRLGEAMSLLNLGRYHMETGDPREALRLHDEAAALFQALDFRRGEVSNLYGAARALHALGEDIAALQRLGEIVDGIEALRAESENQDLRSAYFATKQHYFELYIDVLMRLHEQDPAGDYDTQALALNERRRARSLLETLAESKADYRSHADSESLAQVRRIQTRINAGEERLQHARGEGRDADVAKIEEKQRSLLVELADIESRIGGHGPTPQPLTVPEMQKLLGPWSLLLVYSLGEQRSFLWSLTSDGKLATQPLPPRESLEQAARQVRAAWSHRGGEHGAAGRVAIWLSQKILGPVAEKLGEKRLLIVADGALEALPFAALPDPRALTGTAEADAKADPLVVRNEVIHLPSMSTLATLRRERHRRATPPSWLGIIADPVFSADDPRLNGGRSEEALPLGSHGTDLSRSAEDLGIERFERLPFSRVEAESVAQLVPKGARRLALDFEANRELVESPELKRYRILHFATHGLLNAQHPELSGLVLSLVDAQGKPRDDGFLLAHEIARLNLPAQLVVLSACQTGLGNEVRGEGLISLTRSFMQAGAPRVVVSLWNVNDRATAELMKRFYRAMIDKGLPPSSALRCAQLSMRGEKDWASPFFWAPFIFQGEWRTKNAKGEPPIEKQAVPSRPPPVSDVDYPPPGSDGRPTCPDLHQ